MSCPACGFGRAPWTPNDVLGTLRILDRWFELLAEGASVELRRELAPYAEQVSAVRRRRRSSSPSATLARLHTALHALQAAGRCRHDAGEGAPAAAGRVVRLSVSGGGVPKLPIDRAAVTAAGLAGDRQGNRTHHGRPWQALCLWSAEVIDTLAAEGHPIGYGSAGENVTVGGVDWSTIRPGVRLRIGTALVETTPYTIPCKKNAQWFLDGNFGRMAHEFQPGVSRIYAHVLDEGTVTVGDPVLVEPAAYGDQKRRA